MRLTRALAANAASLSVRLAANFALNKILATLIGPAGFGLVGQLQNFVMLIQSATSGALTTGVTKLTAQADGDLARQSRIWTTALFAVTVLSLTTGLIVALLRGPIARDILGNPIYETPLLLAAISLTAFGVNYVIASVFAGKSDAKSYATLNSAIALVNLAIVSVGAYFGHIEGALMASAVSHSFALVAGLFLFIRRGGYGLSFARPLFDSALVASLAKYGAMALVAAAALALGQLIVRSQIIAQFGLITAGHYEALWRLSNINLMLFSSTLMVYALPQMAQMARGRPVRAFYLKASAAAILLAAGLFAAEYLARAPLFILLFSPEFRPATEFFGYQALGDIARVATLVTSTALIALSRPGQYIGLEIIRFMIFIAASYMLLPAMGPSGAAAAYMVSYGLSAAIGVALMLLARDDGAVIGLQA